MMSLVDICSNFPRISYSDVPIRERNLVFAQMEDGSGYSWNLSALVNSVPYKIYVRFDRVTRKPESIVVEGKQCIETIWEWVA